METVNDRLKIFYNQKGLTQEEFSNKIGASQQYISAVVNNKRSVGPNIINKIKVAYPDLDLHWFLNGTTEKIIDKDKIDNVVVNEPYELFNRTNTNGNHFEKLPDGRWLLKVQMIPYKAQARYISQFCDGELIEGYPEVSFFVDKYGHGNYKGIEITNDSMDDSTKTGTPSGAIALGRELGRHLWKDGFYPTEYGWGIVTNEGFVFKDITAYDSTTGEITCHSRNDSYEDFRLSLNDVLQIFKVIKRQF